MFPSIFSVFRYPLMYIIQTAYIGSKACLCCEVNVLLFIAWPLLDSFCFNQLAKIVTVFKTEKDTSMFVCLHQKKPLLYNCRPREWDPV